MQAKTSVPSRRRAVVSGSSHKLWTPNGRARSWDFRPAPLLGNIREDERLLGPPHQPRRRFLNGSTFDGERDGLRGLHDVQAHGHYGYYGIIGNLYSLLEFREGARRIWRASCLGDAETVK